MNHVQQPLAMTRGLRYFARMTDLGQDDVTRMLQRWREGDADALERLLPLVYADLRRLAASHLRDRSGHTTMQTTALVHDVLLRLLERPPSTFSDGAHFFNAAARMMRQLLTQRTRAATAIKRGGNWRRDEFTEAMQLPIPDDTDLVALDQALTELEAIDRRMAQVVELRYFIGLEMEDIAATLNIAKRTVHRDWAAAQVWLRARLAV